MTAIDPTLAPSPISVESILRTIAIAAILAGLAFGALEWAGHQGPENAADTPASVEVWHGNSGSLPARR